MMERCRLFVETKGREFHEVFSQQPIKLTEVNKDKNIKVSNLIFQLASKDFLNKVKIKIKKKKRHRKMKRQ